MSNWVTLPNGVHIDLDDPNNPLTGDGSFDSYLGGNNGGGSKSIKNVPDVTSKTIAEAKSNFNSRIKGLKESEKNASKEMLKEYLEKQDELDAYDHVSTLIDNGTVARFANKYATSSDGFTPTKQTIWNDKSHPLYGIAPSEQNEDFFKKCNSRNE